MDAPITMALAVGVVFFLYTVYRRPVYEEVLRLRRLGERLAVFPALALMLIDVLVHAGAAEPGYWFRVAAVVLGVGSAAAAYSVAFSAAYTLYRLEGPRPGLRGSAAYLRQAYSYFMMAIMIQFLAAIPVLYANALVNGAFTDVATLTLILLLVGLLTVLFALIANIASLVRMLAKPRGAAA